MSNFYTLANLGWQPFFQQQLALEEWGVLTPARVLEQHKSELLVATEQEALKLALHPSMPPIVVGDWILLDDSQHFARLLERKTCFSRKAAGSAVKQQLISANVDTAFIVCSMNDDFNLSRIERFLAVVNESGADAVILLSKSDLAAEPESFIRQVHSLDSLLPVEPMNCLEAGDAQKLAPWLQVGQTVAVLGSSGVGKSTLVNTLLAELHQSTQASRADDDKGRHTTTRRSLMLMPEGGLLLDTPGMRELQLADCKDGIAATFADIEKLAQQCRFNDCAHGGEPGCAVQKAVASGALEARRLENYRKLLREESLNSASLAERRAQDKQLGKFYKRTLNDAYQLKGR